MGIVFAGVLLSMMLIGGELGQSRLGLPNALTGVFQGLLLVLLLACDTLIHYRVKFGSAACRPRAEPGDPTWTQIALLIAATLASPARRWPWPASACSSTRRPACSTSAPRA